MYHVVYKKENKPDMSPIRKYQMEHCLICEEEGKCDYDKTLLCVSIRLYNLKDYQMNLLKDGDLVTERLGKKE